MIFCALSLLPKCSWEVHNSILQPGFWRETLIASVLLFKELNPFVKFARVFASIGSPLDQSDSSMYESIRITWCVSLYTTRWFFRFWNIYPSSMPIYFFNASLVSRSLTLLADSVVRKFKSSPKFILVSGIVSRWHLCFLFQFCIVNEVFFRELFQWNLWAFLLFPWYAVKNHRDSRPLTECLDGFLPIFQFPELFRYPSSVCSNGCRFFNELFTSSLFRRVGLKPIIPLPFLNNYPMIGLQIP